jgi:hypothetical protein
LAYFKDHGCLTRNSISSLQLDVQKGHRKHDILVVVKIRARYWNAMHVLLSWLVGGGLSETLSETMSFSSANVSPAVTPGPGRRSFGGASSASSVLDAPVFSTPGSFSSRVSLPSCSSSSPAASGYIQQPLSLSSAFSPAPSGISAEKPASSPSFDLSGSISGIPVEEATSLTSSGFSGISVGEPALSPPVASASLVPTIDLTAYDAVLQEKKIPGNF